MGAKTEKINYIQSIAIPCRPKAVILAQNARITAKQAIVESQKKMTRTLHLKVYITIITFKHKYTTRDTTTAITALPVTSNKLVAADSQKGIILDIAKI